MAQFWSRGSMQILIFPYGLVTVAIELTHLVDFHYFTITLHSVQLILDLVPQGYWNLA